MPLFASYSLLIRFLFASHSSHHQIHSCKISIIFVSVYFITKQIRVSFNTNNNSSSSCLLWPLTSLSFLYIFYYYYFFYEGLLVVDSLAVYMYFVLSAREMSSRRLARQCYYIYIEVLWRQLGPVRSCNVVVHQVHHLRQEFEGQTLIGWD